MSKDIHIKIGSSFSGEGFKELNNALKASSNGAKNVIKPVNDVMNAFSDLGGGAGKALSTAGKLLGSFASMGVWGLLIASVSSAVGWFVKWRKETEDTKLAMQGLSREYMTLDAAVAGYNRRIERMKKAHEEAKKAEKERADQAKKILASNEVWQNEDQKKQMLASNKHVDQYRVAQSAARSAALQGEMLGAANPYEEAKIRIRQMAENAQEAVRKARFALDDARIGGDKSEIRVAEINLEAALQRLKNAKEEAKAIARQVKEEYERQAAVARAEDQREKLSEEAARVRAIVAEREKAHADKISELDKRIEEARDRAAKLEENAAKARGISVGDWLKNRRNEEREKAKEERLQAGRMKNAQEELDRLTNPRTRRVRSDWEKKRIADLQEWIADQDPNNNPALQEAQRLEAEKSRISKEQLTELQSLNARLKELTEE